MKNYLLIFTCLVFVSSVSAQNDASAFLSKMPALPKKTCALTSEQKSQYTDIISKLLDEIKDEIKSKRDAGQKNVEESRGQIEKNIAAQYGISENDIAKLKDKKMTKEEKRAMMDKVLQQQIGMSMDEVEKVKNMNKEEKKEWAGNYGAQQMAEMQTPEGQKSEKQLALEKNMTKGKALNELMAEQKMLQDKINDADKKFAAQLDQFENEETPSREEMNKQLEPLRNKIDIGAAGNGPNNNIPIWKKIAAIEIKHCEKFTPKYHNILKDRYATVQNNLPNYDRLETVIEEINKTTVGVNVSAPSHGLMALEAVKSLMELQISVFKYSEISVVPEYR